ncbi:hypothetical protein HN371_24355 [Candidatus Poribacteria bacterium]|jgi:hypothetical protein|nr:hypothetical protein [Candidatus Poribacteria bacterium]MBT5536823.1 hypothetical protein [Candidatus Poribacteria bacterium]MBT5710927.1 hypothetical protein [Candidatus Poribacteria bacterium]MBT7100627.1 hypothetical protein [Candidatus Poribacteria bacterium]MBT7808505.1 hypothetical protein [Candidatus Poribacteria bacterium]
MGALWKAIVVPAGCMFAAITFLFTLLLVKILWAWTVPDLFPRAVSEGYVAASLSWMTALKVALFVGVLAGVSGAKKG